MCLEGMFYIKFKNNDVTDRKDGVKEKGTIIKHIYNGYFLVNAYSGDQFKKLIHIDDMKYCAFYDTNNELCEAFSNLI